MQLYVYVDNVDFNLPISEMSLLNRFEWMARLISLVQETSNTITKGPVSFTIC